MAVSISFTQGNWPGLGSVSVVKVNELENFRDAQHCVVISYHEPLQIRFLCLVVGKIRLLKDSFRNDVTQILSFSDPSIAFMKLKLYNF